MLYVIIIKLEKQQPEHSRYSKNKGISIYKNESSNTKKRKRNKLCTSLILMQLSVEFVFKIAEGINKLKRILNNEKNYSKYLF